MKTLSDMKLKRKELIKPWLYTTTMRPIDNNGEDFDFECKDPAKGKLPLSTNRRVEPTGLLDMIPQVNGNKTRFNNLDAAL